MLIIKKFFLYALISILLSISVNSSAIERRRDQYGKDFSYYLYPIGGDIPGLGQAFGAGGSALNIANTDMDFVGYYVRGDFNATGATLLDIQLIRKRLIFDIGYNDFLVAPIVYDRGINSNPANFIQPKVEGAYILGQLTLSFNERQYEYFYRHLRGYNNLLQILNNEGEEFDLENSEKETIASHSLGASIDLTDDKLEPRWGIRFEVTAKLVPQQLCIDRFSESRSGQMPGAFTQG